MQPTINKDFTPEQQQRYIEQSDSRKDRDKPIEMQCLKISTNYGRSIMRITVWKATLLERLKIAVTGRIYLTMSGKPMVWIDSSKPYTPNELIQERIKPKLVQNNGNQPTKKLTPLGDAGTDELMNVIADTDGKGMRGADGIPIETSPNTQENIKKKLEKIVEKSDTKKE